MRLKYLFKTITQLGFTQVGLFVLYKLGLKTGYFKRKTTLQLPNSTLRLLFDFPAKEELLAVLGTAGLKELVAEADEIVDGKFRIFGGELVEIKLDFNHSLSHWTDYETGKVHIPNTEYRKLNTALNLPLDTCDLKLLWEPARFGWAFTLGRAFHATDERKYVEAFWRQFETFDKANPVDMGPHWMNGQEVAIRLMALVWAAQAFWDARVSTNQQLGRLAESIAEHAERIPLTLIYARSQNNNHLVSEAAALYTAALALPDHPDVEKWRKIGIKWLNWSFENQIDDNGEYIQHSVNYHRLMLQLALWVSALTTKDTIPIRAQAEHEEKREDNLRDCLKITSRKGTPQRHGEHKVFLCGHKASLCAHCAFVVKTQELISRCLLREYLKRVSRRVRRTLIDTFLPVKRQKAHPQAFFRAKQVRRTPSPGLFKQSLREPLCPLCLNKLANATRRLADLTDPISGNTPNLGSNDGAYIFLLANSDFRDARPIVQAASHVFLNETPFSTGAWDEMSLWFQQNNRKTGKPDNALPNQATIKPSNSTWAHLRTAGGNLRLAHADQLHLDLWWQGTNIALDPGTYLYNAEPPWDNPLAATKFHNTVTVNGQDQMTRASRFMYLDWSHGQIVEQSDSQIIAEHDGYRKLGITHRRAVSFVENTWRVEDNLQSSTLKTFTYRLHWLLRDAEWKVESSNEKTEISLQTQAGILNITQHATRNTQHASSFSLARAGKLLHGNAEIPPTRGWHSPTYGVKIPALSLALEVAAAGAVQFTTEFKLFPDS